MTKQARIAVIGAGAWGTALGTVMVRAGHDARIWARDRQLAEAINKRNENPRYLPGIPLDARLAASNVISEVVAGAASVLCVVPAQTLRDVLDQIAAEIPPGVPVVLCAKGIDQRSGKLPSELAASLLPQNAIAALSGPSFATDVARGLPTAVTVASSEARVAQELAAQLSSTTFRCYFSDDLSGVEIGGALKNVMAIAVGAAAGAGLGASAQAALVTRGFVELRRLSETYGARPETIMGLSGLGDLVLTCSSAQSRNFAYGIALGKGETLDGLPLAEGVATARIAARIAAERAVSAPIIASVDRILAARATVEDEIRALLARPLKSESDPH